MVIIPAASSPVQAKTVCTSMPSIPTTSALTSTLQAFPVQCAHVQTDISVVYFHNVFLLVKAIRILCCLEDEAQMPQHDRDSLSPTAQLDDTDFTMSLSQLIPNSNSTRSLFSLALSSHLKCSPLTPGPLNSGTQ